MNHAATVPSQATQPFGNPERVPAPPGDSPRPAKPGDSARELLRALAVVLALTALMTAALLLRARASGMRDKWPPEADTFYLPPAGVLQVLSFGHSELAADLIHARANVYFGTQMHARMPTKWLASYLKTALDLDPLFQRLYVSGAAMLVYNGQRITPDMVLEANSILERGRKAFPFDGEIAFHLGFNLLFELPNDADPSDGRIPGWRQAGVEILRQAALLEGAPPYMSNLVARMLTKQGSQDLAIKHLEQAYAAAASDDVREQLRRKLFTLRGRQFSDNLAEMHREFAKLIEKGFPHLPEALSLVIGPRITSTGILVARPPMARVPAP